MHAPSARAAVQVGVSVFRQDDRHLRRCVESILEQEGITVDLVIRLDGPDSVGTESLDWLRQMACLHPQLRLIEGAQRLGTFGSYREIFASGDSDYLCQVDADDYLAPRALLIAHSLLSENERASFLYTQCIDVDVNDTPLGLGRRALLPFSVHDHLLSFMTFHLRLVRRHHYQEVGGYRSDLSFTGDYDLSLKLAEVGDVVFLNQPLYFYRLHQQSTSQKRKSEVDAEALRICNEALVRRGLSETYALLPSPEGGVQCLELPQSELPARSDHDQRTDLGVDAPEGLEYVNTTVFYVSPAEAH